MLCVLHRLASKGKAKATFVFAGYSLCEKCMKGTARDLVLIQQAMHGLLLDAMEEDRLP